MSGRSLSWERLDPVRPLHLLLSRLQALVRRAMPHRHSFGPWERSRLHSHLEHRLVMVRRCPCGAKERVTLR